MKVEGKNTPRTVPVTGPTVKLSTITAGNTAYVVSSNQVVEVADISHYASPAPGTVPVIIFETGVVTSMSGNEDVIAIAYKVVPA